ncbi:unnamed protein product [Pleuronectes platessa]|uniref:Uncharacterized protein n=1 Tax=Pleuronectes platessa TaxID=8262 RepID=A0A9N7VD67_PLEPL|nr:unnamed protein product [Pleuronectes platessa]
MELIVRMPQDRWVNGAWHWDDSGGRAQPQGFPRPRDEEVPEPPQTGTQGVSVKHHQRPGRIKNKLIEGTKEGGLRVPTLTTAALFSLCGDAREADQCQRGRAGA